jgi:hypothetical protein
MPIDRSAAGAGPMTPAGIPTAYPTYDTDLNNLPRNDGLNEADEMNLYGQNPLLDSPFGPGDLEWLYRQQDVDGSSLDSRLKDLAPISFRNTLDGQRRRRLFALDAWELNNFVWTGDNPGGAFANNARFIPLGSNASLFNLNLPTPALAHRDKKINLNYPLPVSNDPNEPIRQKWINTTYQLLKIVLPPRSVDTPEELAQLGQFVVNIIDFRDPDGTITIWNNPDVSLVPAAPAATPAVPAPYVVLNVGPFTPPPTAPTAVPFIQYGVEYNPVALNEALAYSFAFYNPTGTGASQGNQFFIELVNTLSQSAIASLPPPAAGGPANPVDPSILDLGGFAYTANDPYSGGCWDMVLTADDTASRPDPFRGELVIGGNYYGLVPLNKDSFATPTNIGNSAPSFSPGYDVTLQPLTPGGPPAATLGLPTAAGANYYYVLGSAGTVGPNGLYVTNTPAAIPTNYPIVTQNNAPAPNTYPSLVQNFSSPTIGTGAGAYNFTFDPLNGAPPTAAQQQPIVWYPGVLPGVTPGAGGNPATPPPNFQWKLPLLTAGTAMPGVTKYFWVCLRRPANPFAPVSATNPMVVVDSMRVPYIDGSVQLGTAAPTPPAGGPGQVPQVAPGAVNGVGDAVFSAQRFQPYRGGHAVPNPYVAPPSIDTRYGFTEQIVGPALSTGVGTSVSTLQGTQGIYYVDTANNNKAYYSSNVVYHTLGAPNETAEPWDMLAFHDRDFSSVAELLLVPGCPPGLFTKLFAEFAPSNWAATTVFKFATPQTAPGVPLGGVGGAPPGPYPIPSFSLTGTSYASAPFALNNIAAPVNPGAPHSFPYMVDKFFYTGASLAVGDTPGSTVGGPASDGWSKMLEFVEVPSLSFGAIGAVASGTNFDWARQDAKPGLLNPNLIIDEEVLFSLLGKQGGITDSLLNFLQIPALNQYGPNGNALPPTLRLPLLGRTPIPAFGSPVPLVVSAIDFHGSPSYVYPISNPNHNAAPGGSAGPGAGVTAIDPILNLINTGVLPVPTPPLLAYDSRIKAAFAQFLWLRHGGSGYLFGFGSAQTGQNSSVVPYAPPAPLPANYGLGIPFDRPFHSLSYPDLDFTVMRPAVLPPSLFTNPPASATAGDPGVRNANLFPGYTSTALTFGGVPGNTLAAGTPVLPPAIPARRLFQVPDGYQGNPATTPVLAASNASEQGDPFINNLVPTPPMTPTLTAPSPAAGALPPWAFPVTGPTTPIAFTGIGTGATSYSFPNLYWSVWSGNTFAAPVQPATQSLGASNAPPIPPAAASQADNRQHPVWRSEQLQRVVNLTTVRTHQYAVWITIGFFQVKRQGDIGMLATDPRLAFDILGSEIGALSGKVVRYRSFFLVNRLNLTGFNPGSPGLFRAAVTYRQRIQ